MSLDQLIKEEANALPLPKNINIRPFTTEILNTTKYPANVMRLFLSHSTKSVIVSPKKLSSFLHIPIFFASQILEIFTPLVAHALIHEFRVIIKF